MKRLLGVTLALALIGCATPQTLAVGQTLDVGLTKLGGGPFSFESLRGRVVVVDVWASWCRPCTDSLPFYSDLENALKADGFTFVGINVDADERAAWAFLKDASLDLTTLYDPGAHVVEPRFGVKAMPTTFFIDRKGTIRHVHEGFSASDKPAFRQKIEALLAEH